MFAPASAAVPSLSWASVTATHTDLPVGGTDQLPGAAFNSIIVPCGIPKFPLNHRLATLPSAPKQEGV